MVQRVLVAVDGTPASNAALEIACALADNYEAALGLLSVVAPDEISDGLIEGASAEGVIKSGSSYSDIYSASFSAYSSSSTYQDIQRTQKAVQLASLLADEIVAEAKAYSAQMPFKAIKTFVDSGDPAKAILKCAENNNVDIIIMGHDQQGRVEALFKHSVANTVQRDAHCPVLIYSMPKSD